VLTRVAPESTQVGEHMVTQKHLYTALFVIGLPLLWWSSPIGTFFWIGASAYATPSAYLRSACYVAVMLTRFA
jgi:hypothetical protein